jgi:hypothetical protein
MTASSAFVERTIASRQFSHEELRAMFDGMRKDFNNDFPQAFIAMHLETMERCAQLESRVKALEARRK